MCAIIGIASKNKVLDRRWLGVGADAMRHRGPDDSGEWWSSDGRVGLAHRRLAIIDPSPAGHQPMADTHGRCCIVFNGEIYNWADLRQQLADRGVEFRSHCDTEVLLAAYREWGPDCLSKLEGMFAFAIHDADAEKVFLARDRAGEKPLFYSADSDTIRFSSEVKGLLADPTVRRAVDPEALDCYLAQGYVSGDRCILRGFKKLPPAHALLFDQNNGTVKVWRYWDLPDPQIFGAPTPNDALLDELEAIMAQAVRQQLVADVPIGLLLSGGVDSSLVTALAARFIPTLKTFTVRFSAHKEYDETGHARLIAQHFGTEHLELDARVASVEVLPVLARQCDEPIIDSSIVPAYLVCQLVSRYCKVVLGGDGGDELFGGYHYYSRLLFLHRQCRRVPGWLRRAVGHGAVMALPIGLRGRDWIRAVGSDFDRGLPLVPTHYDVRSRRRLLGGRLPAVAERIREMRVPGWNDLLQRATRMDFENYLAEDILVKVDRASMANSLEVRAPMLDLRLLEFAYRKVPSDLKATASTRKVLLKSLTRRLLPPSFDRERKQGFSIPLSTWLRAGPWRAFVQDVLLDEGQNVFDKVYIGELLRGLDHGWRNGERLFGLLMCELWRREYRVDMGEFSE